MIDVKIINSIGNGGYGVAVTKRGQIVTAPLNFSIPENVTLNVINTAFNLRPPITGKIFVITDLIISTDKNVNVNGAIIEIYLASSVDTLTSDKTLLLINLGRQDSFDVVTLNWISVQGKWLNAKTDEANVDITAAGYYVDA